jgi:hypothetical protein
MLLAGQNPRRTGRDAAELILWAASVAVVFKAWWWWCARAGSNSSHPTSTSAANPTASQSHSFIAAAGDSFTSIQLGQRGSGVPGFSRYTATAVGGHGLSVKQR